MRKKTSFIVSLGRGFLFSLTLLSLLSVFARGAVAADAAVNGGPAELLISYRTAPADRPAFRAYMQGEGRVLLDKLKQEGVLKSYQILFNSFVTADTWDAMTVLSFTSYAQTARWKEIEKKSPGGLTPAGLKLARPLETYASDLAWEGDSGRADDAQEGVYYVIPYSYNSAGDYKKYIDAFLIPQVQGWMKEGVLSHYRIYMNRYPVGHPWDSLFIYQYKDLASFGRREEAVAKTRATLADDPLWKHYNEIRSSLRSESENTIAELLPAVPAAGQYAHKHRRDMPAPASK